MKKRKAPELIVSSLFLNKALSNDAYKTFCVYADSLQKAGLKDGDIAAMLSDLYFASQSPSKRISKNKDSISSICSAAGWIASYKIDGKILNTPLSCWALTTAGKIVGVVADGRSHEIVSEDKFFVECIHEKTIG